MTSVEELNIAYNSIPDPFMLDKFLFSCAN